MQMLLFAGARSTLTMAAEAWPVSLRRTRKFATKLAIARDLSVSVSQMNGHSRVIGEEPFMAGSSL